MDPTKKEKKEHWEMWYPKSQETYEKSISKITISANATLTFNKSLTKEERGR